MGSNSLVTVVPPLVGVQVAKEIILNFATRAKRIDKVGKRKKIKPEDLARAAVFQDYDKGPFLAERPLAHRSVLLQNWR